MNQALKDTLSIKADSPLQRAIDQSDLKWRVLGTLNVFRLILALVLILLFFAGDEPRLIGDRYPSVFSATNSANLSIATVFG